MNSLKSLSKFIPFKKQLEKVFKNKENHGLSHN